MVNYVPVSPVWNLRDNFTQETCLFFLSNIAELWKIFIKIGLILLKSESWLREASKKNLSTFNVNVFRAAWTPTSLTRADAPCCLRALYQTRSHLQLWQTDPSRTRTNARVMSYHRSCFWSSDLPWLDARCVYLLFQLDSPIFACSRASSPTTLLGRDAVEEWCFSGRSPPSRNSSMQSNRRRRSTDSSALGFSLQCAQQRSRWN